MCWDQYHKYFYCSIEFQMKLFVIDYLYYYRKAFTFRNSAEQKSLFYARNSPNINKSIMGKLKLFAWMDNSSIANVACFF